MEHKYSTWLLLALGGIIIITLTAKALDGIGDKYYLAKFLYGGVIGNSQITDDGLTVNISYNLHVDGNVSMKRPYAMYSDLTTQRIGVANTAYPVNFSVTEDDYLMSIASNRQNITFLQSGDYLIIVSAIVDVDTPNKAIEIWAQRNGENINNSNTRVVVPSSLTETLIVVPFVLDMNSGDQFRLMWASSDAGSRLVYTTNTSYSPASPSIIMTITKMSEVTD